ncbi:MAG: hypothetical protein KVP17_003977 [Porospora cf. gigantea B]|nr:MAG: hypothetical protein KVP17_003977 [Porospora cf. gigantea B]
MTRNLLARLPYSLGTPSLLFDVDRQIWGQEFKLLPEAFYRMEIKTPILLCKQPALPISATVVLKMKQADISQENFGRDLFLLELLLVLSETGVVSVRESRGVLILLQNPLMERAANPEVGFLKSYARLLYYYQMLDLGDVPVFKPGLTTNGLNGTVSLEIRHTKEAQAAKFISQVIETVQKPIQCSEIFFDAFKSVYTRNKSDLERVGMQAPEKECLHHQRTLVDLLTDLAPTPNRLVEDAMKVKYEDAVKFLGKPRKLEPVTGVLMAPSLKAAKAVLSVIPNVDSPGVVTPPPARRLESFCEAQIRTVSLGFPLSDVSSTSVAFPVTPTNLSHILFMEFLNFQFKRFMNDRHALQMQQIGDASAIHLRSADFMCLTLLPQQQVLQCVWRKAEDAYQQERVRLNLLELLTAQVDVTQVESDFLEYQKRAGELLKTDPGYMYDKALLLATQHFDGASVDVQKALRSLKVDDYCKWVRQLLAGPIFGMDFLSVIDLRLWENRNGIKKLKPDPRNDFMYTLLPKKYRTPRNVPSVDGILKSLHGLGTK